MPAQYCFPVWQVNQSLSLKVKLIIILPPLSMIPCIRTALPTLYYYPVMEIATGIQIEALEGERVTAQQSSSKKRKNEESKEGEKAENL